MSVGRKRSFDKSAALDKAMRLFWKNGYSGTSVSDLTELLGINKPSLYAAFGNKEQLFTSALQHYRSSYGEPVLDKLDNPQSLPLRDRIQAYMTGVIDLVSDQHSPKGCLFVKSSCESGSSWMPDGVTESLQDQGLQARQKMTALFEDEQQQGRLSREVKANEAADYLMSVLYGISVMARQGRARKDLIAIVEMALKTLPVGES
ncbi:MAG: TetR/AcrR family transcriptional regulator [Candidatus Thiodiazotropha lotti]|nr:TetR/AcrR family transcriptional regulator [Candidatus Thiodiazotropha lotti]MCG8001727.1 TetR/AcrR family transcriptional regulator [Candidatus Thiodiazotropha lotti]MCW4184098.1 TetR/AcrR family transcriptional regulator [Candidatus Thiodiazotropha weberae]MCW4193501.1 TetR/AcrR family transcriptional regulator [Candidatus Thiodiazotropha weberae]